MFSIVRNNFVIPPEKTETFLKRLFIVSVGNHVFRQTMDVVPRGHFAFRWNRLRLRNVWIFGR